MGAFLVTVVLHSFFFFSSQAFMSQSDSAWESLIPHDILVDFEAKVQAITEEVLRKHNPRNIDDSPVRRKRRQVANLNNELIHGFIPDLSYQRDRIQIDSLEVLSTFKPCALHYGQWDTAYFNNEDYAILLCPESVQSFRYESSALVFVNSLPFKTSTEQVLAMRNFKIRDGINDSVRMMVCVLLHVPGQGASLRMYEIIPSVGLVEFQELQLTGNFLQMEPFVQDGSTYLSLLRSGINKSDLVVYGLEMDKGQHIDFTLMAIRSILPASLLRAYPILANIGLFVDNPDTQTGHLYLFSQQTIEPFQVFNNLSRVVDAEFFQIGSRYFLAVLTADRWRVLMFNANEDFFYEFQTTYIADLVGLRILDLNSFRDEKAIVLQSINGLGHSVLNTYVLENTKFIEAGNQSCTSGVLDFGKLPIKYLAQNESLTCLSGGNLVPILGNAEARLIDGHPMLILPYTNGHTTLIYFEASLVPVKNPVEMQRAEIAQRVANHKAALDALAKRMADIEALFTNTVSTDLKNTLTGNWKVGTLTTLAVEVEELNYGNLYLQDQDWGESLPSLDILEANVAELQNIIADLGQRLVGAIPNKTTETVYFPSLEVIGNLHAPALDVQDLTAESINGVDLAATLNDIVRTDLDRRITGLKKILGSLTSQVFHSDDINGIQPKDILTDSDSLAIVGELTFTEPFLIEGNVIIPSGKSVGGLDLSEQVLTFESSYGELVVDGTVTAERALVDKVDDVVFDSLNFQELLLEGSHNATFHGPLHFESMEIQGPVTALGSVSGRDLEKFAQDLLRVDRSENYAGLININGKVIVGNNLGVVTLQGHKYPEDFAKSHGSSVFRGINSFTNLVTADVVHIDGLVDGRNASQLITLTTEQEVYADTIFNFGFQTDSLKITNNANGMHFDSLIDYGIDAYLVAIGQPATKIVFAGNSNTILGQLQTNLVNSKDLEGVLADIVYKDESDVVVTAHKNISNMYVINAIVLEGFNNINVEEVLLTKDSEQNITGAYTFSKPVTLDTMLTPMANTIDMDTLLANVAKLNQDRTFRTSDLTFQTIVVKNLIVRDNINDANASTVLVQGLDQDFVALQVFSNASFNSLEAENLILPEGGLVSGVDLSAFDARRFSLTRNQVLSSDVTVLGDVTIGGVLAANKINTFPWEEWKSSFVLENAGHKQVINTGIEAVSCKFEKEVHVPGRLNGIANVHDLAQVAIDIREPINFDNVHFQLLNAKRTEVQGFVNDVDLPELHADVAYHGSLGSVLITGTKMFQNITVENNVRSLINGKDFERDVLRTKGDQVISSHLLVAGSFLANGDFDLSWVNDISQADLYKVPALTPQVITGSVTLTKDVHVSNLKVQSINNNNLDEFFANVAFKQAPNAFLHPIHFHDQVDFHGELSLTWLNGRDFAKDVDALVFKDKNASIRGTVTFRDDLVLDLATIDVVKAGAATPNFLSSFQNAVFLGQPDQFIRGNYTMANVEFMSSCNVRGAVNGISIPGGLVLLSHEQQLPGSKTIPGFTVLESIDFKSSATINGRHLLEESQNTLLVIGNFTLNGSKVMEGQVQTLDATVNEVNGFVWDKEVIFINNAEETVTIYGNPNFDGEVHVVKDVRLIGSTNNVNLAALNDGVLFADMIINTTGTWSIPNANIKRSMFTLEPQSYLDRFLVSDLFHGNLLGDLSSQITTNRGAVEHANHTALEWQEILANAYYKVTAYDLTQSIDLRYRSAAVAEIQAQSKRFLLVGTSTCSSLVYVWDGPSQSFKYHSIVSNTGSVTQWIVAKQAVLAVVKPTSQCNMMGLRSFFIRNGVPSVQNLGVEYMEAGLTLLGNQVHLLTGNTEKLHDYLVIDGGLSLDSTITGRSIEVIARSDGTVPYVAIWFADKLSIWGESRAMITTLPISHVQWMHWVRVVDAFYLFVSESPEPVKGGGCIGIKVYEVLPASTTLYQMIPCCAPTAITSLEFGNFPDSMVLVGDSVGTHVYFHEGILGFTKQTILPVTSPQSLFASFHDQQLRIFATASEKVYVIEGRALGTYLKGWPLD